MSGELKGMMIPLIWMGVVFALFLMLIWIFNAVLLIRILRGREPMTDLH